VGQGIRLANLGISVALDSDGLRISFPELTSDRRILLIKSAKEKLEEARITLRTEREKALSSFDREEKAGNIGEDDKFRMKNELQKLVDEANKKLEELYNKKEKETQQ
jgi:ribosome recycling factor